MDEYDTEIEFPDDEYLRAAQYRNKGNNNVSKKTRDRVLAHMIKHHSGENNAITLSGLKKTAIGDIQAREIRAVMSISDGVGTANYSGNKGYYICQTVEEVKETNRKLRGQAKSMIARADRRDLWVDEHAVGNSLTEATTKTYNGLSCVSEDGEIPAYIIEQEYLRGYRP